MTTPSVNCKPTGEFAASGGCISAVEIHDHLPQQSSLERGDLETKPERPILNELHLFAGCGGGILGGLLLGHHPVCAVEIEPYCRRVLLQRQRDGVLPRFPIWDDVRTFDGKPWRGRVDVVCGGFPCQDISSAGSGAGLRGERSGLWGEMARVVREVGPRFVFVENSPMLTIRGMGTVLADLAAMGYDARWGVFSAADAGARHERERMWIMADAHKIGWKKLGKFLRFSEKPETERTEAFGNPSDAPRNTDGVAYRVDRLAATGNGQVPAVAALAWRVLSEGVRLRGMRVELPKGEAVATEGRKYNTTLDESPK